jgi:hypothetical protein
MNHTHHVFQFYWSFRRSGINVKMWFKNVAQAGKLGFPNQSGIAGARSN